MANRMMMNRAQRLALQARTGMAPQEYIFEPQIFPQVLPAYTANALSE
jgi:hypothetical protein